MVSSVFEVAALKRNGEGGSGLGGESDLTILLAPCVTDCAHIEHMGADVELCCPMSAGPIN